MTKVISLMIVEDDDDQYEIYRDAADDLSDDSVKWNLTRLKTAEEARSSLLSSEFDCAIVDLNLDPNDPSDSSGNDILSNIVGCHRFPVFVVSGNLGHLSVEIREKESSFLKFFDRDKPNVEIFNEIRQVYLTGITQILGGRGLIEENLGEIFWKHLANDLDVWPDKSDGQGKALLRYTVSHLSEYLDIPSGMDAFYHEAEFYIKPPIREYIATGDIVEKDDVRYIVLSPACDINVRGIDANGKPIINAKRIALAKLIKVQREDFIENGIIKNESNSGDRASALGKIVKGQSEKHIFFPGYKMLYPSVVDLQNLYSIGFDDYLAEYVRIATVSSPFLKDVQSRLSAYYGRQGQPDLNKEALIKQYKKNLSVT